MKEQYQKEVAQIHVPDELLIRTKQAMKDEETRLQKEKKKAKILSFRALSVVAAVLVLMIIYPVAAPHLNLNVKQEEKKPQIQLSEHEPGIISIEKNPIVNQSKLTKEAVDEMPPEFKGGEEIVISDTTVILYKDAASGCFKAYCETKEGAMVYSFDTTDKEELIELLEDSL